MEACSSKNWDVTGHTQEKTYMRKKSTIEQNLLQANLMVQLWPPRQERVFKGAVRTCKGVDTT